MLTPTALVEHAHARGLRTLALTDHDTLGGLREAGCAADRLGLRLVAGSELSVRPPSGSMHLLAYLPSADAEPLATRIREIGEYRAARNQRIVERLNELGYAVEWDDVARRARGRVGRPHIAAALVDAGYVESVQDAFDRLLADGQPAYVDAGSLGPEAAVELVAESGGVPVLAHPYTLRMGDSALERFVARLAGSGLQGVECFRPGPRRRPARIHPTAVRAAGPRADRRLRLARQPRRPGSRRFRAGLASRGHARAARDRMSAPSC